MEELHIDKKILDMIKQKVEINNALIKLLEEMEMLQRYEALKQKIDKLPLKKKS